MELSGGGVFEGKMLLSLRQHSGGLEAQNKMCFDLEGLGLELDREMVLY